MSKKQPPSQAYLAMLDYINSTPDLISSLYDLDLLPEQVNDKKTATNKMCMMAFVWGYQMAKGDLPKGPR